MKLPLFYTCIFSSLVAIGSTCYVAYSASEEINHMNKRMITINDSLIRKLNKFNQSITQQQSAVLVFDTVPGNAPASTYVNGTRTSKASFCFRDMEEKYGIDVDSFLYQFYLSSATGKNAYELCHVCYDRHKKDCDSLQKHFNRASK